MSMGMALLLLLLVLPLVVALAGLLLALAILALDCLSFVARAAGLDWGPDEFIVAIIGVALVTFLVWFVLGSPGMDGLERQKPHAVEGREEWVDAREGTTWWDDYYELRDSMKD